MKKIYTFIAFILIGSLSFAQATLPAPFILASGNYSLTGWDSLSAAGTYPTNMAFQFNIFSEATGYDSSKDASINYDCGYNQKSRNRVLGLGSNGFAFLATSKAQYNDCTSGDGDSNRYVGDAVLAINATGKSGVGVQWKGTIITPGDGSGDTTALRQYTVRLQYRVGASGIYTDVTSGGLPVECNSTGKVAGAVVNLSATLPAACNNQPLVYLRWIYFSVLDASGTRPEIGVDDIQVGTSLFPVNIISFAVTGNNGSASLSWSTATETNFSHFEVERSNGNSVYNSIATIAAHGAAGVNTYSFTDSKPLQGNSNYRLKIVDKDGSFTYSSVASFTNLLSGRVLVYPNPATDHVVFTHPAAGAGAVVSVYGFDGKKLSSIAVPANETFTTIRTAGFSKGNYLIVYADGSQKLSARFSKQ